MIVNRRDWLRRAAMGLAVARGMPAFGAGREQARGLRILGLKVTPIALPDPPLLASSGCHGPYALRNVVELEVEGGIVGLGETHGGEAVTQALEASRRKVVGQDAFAYRHLAIEPEALSPAAYAGIELACLDACGQATGRRVCDLLGGPVRSEVEFAAYLFFRYAADHPTVLDDPRIADGRGRGGQALDAWGEVRTPAAMADLAAAWRDRWGFRVFKLKGGVLAPDREREALEQMAARLGPGCLLRIDPNARWTVPTAVRIGQAIRPLPMEYYEDPVAGQAAMAEVRSAVGLPMSTNMCVTRFSQIPQALRLQPIDVLLCDHHYFGGMAGCLALGPIARAAGWRLSQHSNNHAGIAMAAMIHLAATLPELTLASDTHYPWLPPGSDIIEGPPLAIQGGRMAIPSGAGLGVTLDRDRLARAHETYQKCGMRRRDDAGLMRRLEPGWTGKLF